MDILVRHRLLCIPCKERIQILETINSINYNETKVEYDDLIWLAKCRFFLINADFLKPYMNLNRGAEAPVLNQPFVFAQTITTQ